MTFLDVGQGDATLLQDGERSVLVDAGPPEAGIVELLRGAGVRRLDLFVATHASADHEGGAAAVVSALPVDLILDGRDGVSTGGGDAMAATARARGIRLMAARAGQELRLDGLRLRVLWPRPEAPALHAGADPNERAVVLEAEARGARALLTADAESEVLSRLELRPVDVLKVAHHGSADPGLPALLDRLRPRVAGIEVGAGNAYGHPAPRRSRPWLLCPSSCEPTVTAPFASTGARRGAGKFVPTLRSCWSIARWSERQASQALPAPTSEVPWRHPGASPRRSIPDPATELYESVHLNSAG